MKIKERKTLIGMRINGSQILYASVITYFTLELSGEHSITNNKVLMTRTDYLELKTTYSAITVNPVINHKLMWHTIQDTIQDTSNSTWENMITAINNEINTVKNFYPIIIDNNTCLKGLTHVRQFYNNKTLSSKQCANAINQMVSNQLVLINAISNKRI